MGYVEILQWFLWCLEAKQNNKMKKSMMMSWLGRMMPFQLCKRLKAFKNDIGIKYNKMFLKTETEKSNLRFLGRFCDDKNKM